MVMFVERRTGCGVLTCSRKVVVGGEGGREGSIFIAEGLASAS